MFTDQSVSLHCFEIWYQPFYFNQNRLLEFSQSVDLLHVLIPEPTVGNFVVLNFSCLLGVAFYKYKKVSSLCTSCKCIVVLHLLNKTYFKQL